MFWFARWINEARELLTLEQIEGAAAAALVYFSPSPLSPDVFHIDGLV